MARASVRVFFGNAAGISPTISVVPTSDTNVGSWHAYLDNTQTGASLSSALGDGSASTSVRTSAPSVFVVQLAPVTNPQTNSGLSLHFNGSAVLGSSFKLSLYDGNPGSGGTLISEWTSALSTNTADFSHSISPAEAANINSASYAGNLYLRGEAV